MFASVRMRLTLWYVGVLALVLVAVCGGVYLFLAHNLYGRLDGELRSAIESVAVALVNERAEGETESEAAKNAIGELYLPRQAVVLFNVEGSRVAEKVAPGNLHSPRPPASMARDEHVQYFSLSEEAGGGDDGSRVAFRQVKISPSGSLYEIVVSQSLGTLSEELEKLREIFFLVVPLALAMAGFGGWLLARKSLAPVVAMSEQARRISAQNLEERLPVANPQDELGRLAITFNDLLARLSGSFSQQRQFMADTSHELRTPLSVMHTAAEVTLEKQHREESEYREALSMIDEQTRRLTRIVEEMFLLARADAGNRTLQPMDIDLSDVVSESARAAAVLAERKNLKVEVSAALGLHYRGDAGLLRQMLLNLLDNAVKCTPTAGLIRVSLSQEDSQYLITVSDTGEGIPVEAQLHIFDRFFRLDKARSRAESSAGSGAGLGLSIARWIAEAHEGRLELVHSDHSGSTFRVSLPRA